MRTYFPCIARQLAQQNWREIYNRARFGNRFQMRGHVCIVLQRVQIGPRLRTLASNAVFRLMHVPAQHHIESIQFTHDDLYNEVAVTMQLVTVAVCTKHTEMNWQWLCTADTPRRLSPP